MIKGAEGSPGSEYIRTPYPDGSESRMGSGHIRDLAVYKSGGDTDA